MNISIYNQFSESAMLNNKHDIKTRNHNMDFANFRITGCERHDWWYGEFIGIEFLGIITYDKYLMKMNEQFNTKMKGVLIIKEVRPVSIVGNTKIIIGRDISAKDIEII
ncbi:hypothetical protein [Elizabethkingia miricola]|uniref:hypothetical protein n=1 Tax=Elizabethkingia miricola TaxID=172045 RepID=UPI0038922417